MEKRRELLTAKTEREVGRGGSFPRPARWNSTISSKKKKNLNLSEGGHKGNQKALLSFCHRKPSRHPTSIGGSCQGHEPAPSQQGTPL